MSVNDETSGETAREALSALLSEAGPAPEASAALRARLLADHARVAAPRSPVARLAAFAGAVLDVLTPAPRAAFAAGFSLLAATGFAAGMASAPSPAVATDEAAVFAEAAIAGVFAGEEGLLWDVN